MRLPIQIGMLVFFCSVFTFGQKADTTTIKLFFDNEKLNPNTEDCGKVFPVTRKIPKTMAVATAALQELFKGPTKEEEAKGYIGYTPAETNGILRGVNVKSSSAYVNLSKYVYEQMGNATSTCGGQQFFSMVEATLQQFPTIKKVYYAIDGNADDFYEWVQVGKCPHGKHCSKTNFK